MRMIDVDELLEKKVLVMEWDGSIPFNAVSEVDVIKAPTIEAVPLSEIYRVVAGHSDYHGDNILAALTCIAEGKTVNTVKPLEAEPVRHGRWTWKDFHGDGSLILCCSECLETEGARETSNYCHNCGAKMDKE